MFDYSFVYKDVNYIIKLNHKINILRGDSGTGKSTMVAFIDSLNEVSSTNISTINQYGVDTRLLPTNNLLVIDEEVVREYLKNKRMDLLLGTTAPILIITRSDFNHLKYSFRAVYVISRDVGKLELVPAYSNYDFIPSPLEYTEDQKAGYSYYKQFYENIASAKGKDNLMKLPVGSAFVADGCDFGRLMRKALNANYKMFLPESFEWLLLRYYSTLPDYVDDLNPEKVFEKLCKRNLPDRYDKTRFNKAYTTRGIISNFEISEDYIVSMLKKYTSDASVSDIRKIILNLNGAYNDDEAVKMAIVLHSLNK